MQQYKLKKGQERFRVVDGPYAGREYAPGVTYNDIPPQERNRFDTVPQEAPAVSQKKTKVEVEDAK